MSWEKGQQENRYNFSCKEFNRKLIENTSHLSFEEAQVSLYEFLRRNPGFACELLLGVRLYPYQIITLKGMLVGDYTMFIFSRGGSKCEVTDSKVFTNNGVKKIQDVQVGEYIQSLYQSNRVLAKTVNPEQETYKVITSGGYESEGLDYHRILTFNPETIDFEYKFSKDLKKGNLIPIRKGFNYWPEEQDFRQLAEKNIDTEHKFDATARSMKDWYFFWGLVLGDGCFTGKKINFSTDDEELAIWVKQFVCDVGMTVYTPAKRKKCKIRQKETNYIINFSRFYLTKWMEELGFDFSFKSHQKIIPYKLLNNSKENICALLSGLFATDGYVYVQENPKKNSIRSRVGYCSTSKELIDQVKIILLNLGIESSNGICFKGGKATFPTGVHECRKAWRCVINNSSTTRIFAKEIGFRLGRKQDKLQRALDAQHNGDSGYNQKVPCQKYIEQHYRKTYSLPGDRCELSTGGKSVSRPKLKKILERGEFSPEDRVKLQKLLDVDCYFDTVKSVEKSRAVTVDLQVENEHCYFGNGFISHNSFLAGIHTILECILNQGTQIGILSSSFRQSKIILQKAEDILQKPGAKLAQDCFSGKSFIKKGTDMWEMKIGQSRAIALPLANGQRLRGFRFQQILIDEFLNIEKNIFNEVIMPFLSVIPNPTEREDLEKLETDLIRLGKMTEEERYKWPNNKLILLSSPSFKFEYMYDLYKVYCDLILNKINKSELEESEFGKTDAYRIIMQLAYDILPKEIHDKNLLQQAKETMSEMQFTREFGAQFVDESDGYFRLSKMAACTAEEGQDPAVEIKGSNKDEYILSFDPNWAGSSSADHFAMQVFKLSKHDQKLLLVHSYAVAGLDLKQHHRYFLYILKNFNVVGICGDYMGGQQFIDSWNESVLAKEHDMKIGVLDVKFDEPQDYQDDLQEFKKQYNKGSRNYCILRKPGTIWIREANERLQGDIDHKRIVFASRAVDDHFQEQIGYSINVKELNWDNESKNKTSEKAQMIDFLEFNKDNIELTKAECANIEVKSNPQGSQTFDLPQHLKRQTGPNRARKDSYSALVLGNWFGRIYFDQLFTDTSKKPVSTFTPVVIN